MLEQGELQTKTGSASESAPHDSDATGEPVTGYPVVDVFAGPGGLGEGFASALDDKQRRRFRSVVSIERDAFSHQTLLLRHFVRRQKLWRRRASGLAESSARHRVDVMWRCGHAASADVGWFCV